MKYLAIVFIFLASCQKASEDVVAISETPYKITKNISYNNVNVDVVIDKPANNDVDVLIVYHGTVLYDDKIIDAANSVLETFKTILDRNDMMIVSVAYPEENLLMGDNMIHAEAALLWVKHKADQELGIHVKKIFLGGHSQGGYLVTRLNTMHQTNGVIANGPGPLNLVYRCQLEENGQIAPGITCSLLKNTYGTTAVNPNAYLERSLLNFTQGFKSDILFVQGLNDTPIQMYSWPIFKQDIMNCTNCQHTQFLELANVGHGALFIDSTAKITFNQFINSR
jgi:alpha/beta hydrolase fold